MKKILIMWIAVVMAIVIALPVFAEGTDDFLLAAPSGAPAIAVAGLAENDPEHFRFVAADAIAAEFASGEADFIIAPINAGAKLFKAGKSNYRLVAVVTWGNLVFASQRDGFSLESINGAALTLFGENTINSSVALYVLEQFGITPGSVEYLAGAANTQQLLLTDPDAIVLTAEPAVTAAKIKNEKVTVISLSDPIRQVTGYDGYAQAGLFVREKTLEERPEKANQFIEKIRNAVSETETDTERIAAASVALEILPNEKVAGMAIPNCGIRFVYAAEAREMIEFTANIDLTQFGGAVPDDDFYYNAE